MKTILRLIVVVLLLGGWSVAALALHVVRTPGKIVVVPKNTLGVNDTYVDTRTWTLNDAAAHPALMKRLIGAGKVHALEHLSDLKTGQDVEAQLRSAIESGPTSKPIESKTVMVRTQGH